VWDDLRDISSHVQWMEDAVSITFAGNRTAGVGTAFDCVTKVGPLTLVDHMEITQWKPGSRMGVRHVGVVTGEGRFTLEPAGSGQTRFTWEERLAFPWWLGGSVGAVVGAPALRMVWRRNLRNLAARFSAV
jgi:hypothetical protein